MTAKSKTVPGTQLPLADMGKEAFITWTNAKSSREAASVQMGEAMEAYRGVQIQPASGLSQKLKTKAGYRQDYSDLDTNVSGRPGMTWLDYEAFRPGEAVPRKVKNILASVNEAYQKVGIIRTTIDLMGDFACQGIRLTHPNPRIQKFYQKWFKKVNGKERSERFLNNLFRSANVIIRRKTVKLNKSAQKDMFKAKGDPDLKMSDIKKNQTNLGKREIPIQYTFINPLIVDIQAGPLASFVRQPVYTISLPEALKQVIKNPKTEVEKKIVKQLPEEIKKAARSSEEFILDPDKTRVFHYKKDDWQTWAIPMIYSILSQINMLAKMELADAAALDGAISNIRLWILGSLEHKIAPTRAAATKLGEILENNTGGGTMDLIWGPDIEFRESKTDVHKFLGSEKFKPYLNGIYDGLGIPPTLTATLGSSGTTNNFISLKTLIQRLKYGRNRLVEFWMGEIEDIQKSMGFTFPAHIEFSTVDLLDGEAEKALLIQLADRNLISKELLNVKFEHDHVMEATRLSREQKAELAGKEVPRYTALMDESNNTQYKKILLQKDSVTPGEVGVQLNPREEGEQTVMEIQNEQMEKMADKQAKQVKEDKAIKPAGRPKNSNDKQKRKTKQFKPKQKAAWDIWAKSAQEKISAIVHPVILTYCDKKNMRGLSDKESQMAEQVKFGVLSHVEPFSRINQEVVEKALDLGYASQELMTELVQTKNSTQKLLNRQLTLNELRSLQISVLGDFYGDY